MPAGPSLTATVVINATKARVSCSSPVVIRSLPLSITRQAAGAGVQLLPTAVTQVDAQTFDLTYAAACVATDKITIPANCPEVRGVAGGQLNPSVTTF
jgi:hypothetical protein